MNGGNMSGRNSDYSASRTKANYKDVFYQGSALVMIRLDDTFPFPDDLGEVSRSLEAYHLREAFQFTLDYLEHANVIRRFKQEVRNGDSDVDLSRFDLMYSLCPNAYVELQAKSQDLTLGTGNESIVINLKKALREKEVDVRRQVIRKLTEGIFKAVRS